MMITIKRVFRAGFVQFWRNGFVSFTSVLMMIVALSFIGAVLFSGAVLQSSLDDLRNKVDVNVYFATSAAEKDVLAIKDTLTKLGEVKEVTYTSREQALEDFKARHVNDELTLQALDELEDNPLGAVLNIRAKNPGEYEGIANFLKSESAVGPSGTSIISSVDYNRNKTAIDKLTRIINVSEKAGLGLTILLIVISILITLNTVRLAIYVSREEISVMRLVGAENQYIRGPFVVSGVLSGLIAGLITLAVFLPVTYWPWRVWDINAQIFLGIDVFSYYIQHFPWIFFVVVGSGVFIGAVSSYIGVRRYLK
jgi:cell division transport system permease protein